MSGCSISCSLSITVGDDVLIGSGALIMDSNAHPLHYEHRNDDSKTKRAPIVIEDGVFIGARAIILKGVRLGRGAVVGAGAVVSIDVPEMSVVAGNPARIVKYLNN
jgi:acetyltransferase-like isoleucine patch superfamily enzyme